MESKLYEECHEGGGFMAQQAMLKQDETVRTQIPTLNLYFINAIILLSKLDKTKEVSLCVPIKKGKMKYSSMQSQ